MMIGTVDDIDVTGEAGSAGEALCLLQEKSFDLALIDIELPDSSGLDFLKTLRKKHPGDLCGEVPKVRRLWIPLQGLFDRGPDLGDS
jgi:DNA-binding NarL/FixJ family response regulator